MKFLFGFLLPTTIQIGGLFLLFERMDQRWGALVVITLMFLTAGLGKIPRWAEWCLWIASIAGYAIWAAGYFGVWKP